MPGMDQRDKKIACKLGSIISSSEMASKCSELKLREVIIGSECFVTYLRCTHRIVMLLNTLRFNR